MTAQLLDGRALAGRIEESLRAEVETFAGMFRRRPRLVVVLVGDMAASGSYVKSKAAAAQGAPIWGPTPCASNATPTEAWKRRAAAV